jgi:hypothetical protein
MGLAGSISQPSFAWAATSSRMLLWPQERSADLPPHLTCARGRGRDVNPYDNGCSYHRRITKFKINGSACDSPVIDVRDNA